MRRAVPKVKDSEWVRNPIDAFVLAELEKRGFRPSPEADPRTLIRRVTLDLTGLPPTPEEVEAFVQDASRGGGRDRGRGRAEQAYEKVVDRLLASPRYGERWGRRWLDLARYADSNGYTIDSARSIWMYRDWVIQALNADMPFDQFTIEQLAGDMLPHATQSQIIATGFHRNTLINEEGGTDPEQFRIESVVDRANTTGTVFLGLTVGCAQCHSHKFDPISQKEYYQLLAFFNNADEPTLSTPTPEQSRRLEELAGQLTAAQKQLAEYDTGLDRRQGEWEQRVRAEAEPKLSPAVRQILAVPAERRSKEQAAAVEAEYRKLDPGRAPLAAAVATLQSRQKELAKDIPSTLVMKERP